MVKANGIGASAGEADLRGWVLATLGAGWVLGRRDRDGVHLSPVYSYEVSAKIVDGELKTRHRAVPLLLLESLNRIFLPPHSAVFECEKLDARDRALVAGALAEGTEMASVMRRSKLGLVVPGQPG